MNMFSTCNNAGAFERDSFYISILRLRLFERCQLCCHFPWSEFWLPNPGHNTTQKLYLLYLSWTWKAHNLQRLYGNHSNGLAMGMAQTWHLHGMNSWSQGAWTHKKRPCRSWSLLPCKWPALTRAGNPGWDMLVSSCSNQHMSTCLGWYNRWNKHVWRRASWSQPLNHSILPLDRSWEIPPGFFPASSRHKSKSSRFIWCSPAAHFRLAGHVLSA